MIPSSLLKWWSSSIWWEQCREATFTGGAARGLTRFSDGDEIDRFKLPDVRGAIAACFTSDGAVACPHVEVVEGMAGD